MTGWRTGPSYLSQLTSALSLLLLGMLLLHPARPVPLEARKLNGSGTHETDVPDAPPGAGARSDGWLAVGAYSGLPWNTPSSITVRSSPGTDYTLRDIPWIAKPWKTPVFYGARIQAWSRASPLGVMLDFTHNKAIADATAQVEASGNKDGQPVPPNVRIGEMFRTLEFSHGHNMLTVNGLYRLPFATATLKPYVGFGLGIAIPHTEIRYTETSPFTYEYQYAGPVLQALGGVEIRLASRLSLFVEYKFTYSRYTAPMTGVKSEWLPIDLARQFRNWLSGTKPAQGTLTTDLMSQMMIGGLTVRLGPGAGAE